MTTATDIVPGQYDIPAEDYHADPVPGGSLSSTGARRLLECPAKFAWERGHGAAPKRHFDIGTAVHTLTLGVGTQPVRIDAASYRSADAQQQRDQARAAGRIPLLPGEYQQVQDMAAALRNHPAVAEMLAQLGEAEQTFIWRDEATGVWRRSRPDWVADGLVADLKTAANASPAAAERAVYEHGYHAQGAWVLDGVEAVLGQRSEFRLVFVEKEPPYPVAVYVVTGSALLLGEARNRRALEIYAECTASGVWPAYGDDPIHLSLPGWAGDRDIKEYLS